MSENFFFDIEQLPLDDAREDFDDTLKFTDLEHEVVKGVIPAASPLTATMATYVPFKRTLKRRMPGPDVRAVHRALRVADGEAPGTPTRLFGVYMYRRLVAFQKRNGLRADGVYGPATHSKLARHFDAYGRWLLGQTKILTTAELKRQRIVATAMHGYNNRYGIHYTQSGLRMQGVKYAIRPPGYPRWEDCSSFATWCYWVAGLPDPNGLGYNGYGFTGTLGRHGRSIMSAEMKPGDLIFYGWYPHNHVTIYVGNGRCVSHGNESGPLLLQWNYRTVNRIRSYL